MSKSRISIAIAGAAANKAIEWWGGNNQTAGYASTKRLIAAALRDAAQGNCLTKVILMNSEGEGFTLTQQSTVPREIIGRTTENYIPMANTRKRRACLVMSVHESGSVHIDNVGHFHHAKGKPGYYFSPNSD